MILVIFTKNHTKLHAIRLEFCKNYGIVRYLYMRSCDIVPHEPDACKTEITGIVFGDIFWQTANPPEKLGNRGRMPVVQNRTKRGDWNHCKTNG